MFVSQSRAIEPALQPSHGSDGSESWELSRKPPPETFCLVCDRRFQLSVKVDTSRLHPTTQRRSSLFFMPTGALVATWQPWWSRVAKMIENGSSPADKTPLVRKLLLKGVVISHNEICGVTSWHSSLRRSKHHGLCEFNLLPAILQQRETA